jgi:predicted adenine nucleotide alpha hydrolase (AANH) superfamily ATPase
MSDNTGLLLHICCAPCGGGCVNRPEMISPERRVVLYYSNSNLDSREEFDRRLLPVRRLAEFYGLELLVDPYDHEAWLAAVAGLEDEPECGKRCRYEDGSIYAESGHLWKDRNPQSHRREFFFAGKDLCRAVLDQ